MKDLKQFIKESKIIQNILLGNKNYNPKATILNFNGKIGSDEANKDYLKSLMNKKGVVLAIGATGTGKTYTISQAFNELIEDNTKLMNLIKETAKANNIDVAKAEKQFRQDTLYVIACPSKLQNEQNEIGYQFKALVAGENAELEELKVSAVYEKVEEIIELKKIHDKLNIVTVIDEAHTLVNAYDYRDKAVEKLIELSKISTTTIFLTATPENLKFFAFDEIVLFKDDNYKAPTKEVEIQVAEDTKELTKEVATTLEKPFIRVNSKAMADNVALDLRINDNKKVLTVSSDTKTYKVFELNKITYDSIDDVKENDEIAYKAIIKNPSSTIIELNLKKIEVKDSKYLVTNFIKVYDNEVYDGVIRQETLPNFESDVIFTTGVLDAGTNIVKYHPNTIPVFSCLNAKHLQLDDVEQFWNRIRGVVNKSLLLVGKTEDKDKKFLNIDFILKQELEKVERVVKSFELRIEATKLMNDDIEEVKADIEAQLNHIKKDGTKNHMNCISITDDLTVEVDKMMVWKNAYDRFNRQYYYHLDKLVEVINNRLNVPVKIVELDIKKVKSENTNIDKETLKEQVKTTIEVLAEQYPDELEKFFNKKLNLKKVEDVDLIKALKMVEEHTYYKLVRDMLKVGINYNTALEVVKANDKYSQIKDYMIDFQIRANNKDFINKVPLAGEFGIVQEIILNGLCEFNNKGYLKVKTVSKETLQELADTINKEVKSNYTIGKVKKMVKQIFKTSDDKKKGFRITSLNK